MPKRAPKSERIVIGLFVVGVPTFLISKFVVYVGGAVTAHMMLAVIAMFIWRKQSKKASRM